jgi:hypothetical protein
MASVPSGALASGRTTLASRALAAASQLRLPVSTSGRVSRAQAVLAVDAVVGLSAASASASSPYTDVAPTQSGFGAIEAAVKAGLMAGWAPTSGTFDPNAPMSRIDLAILATNALGLQAKAHALIGDTSLYPRLGDLGSAGYDLGFANAMLEAGVVPPESATRYAPRAAVTATTLAVAVYRMWLLEDVPVAVSLSAAAPSVLTSQPDTLRFTAANRLGRAVPEADLARYAAAFTATSPGAVRGVAFSADQPGSYTVRVTLSGPFLRSPASTAITIGVGSRVPPVAYAVSTTSAGTYVAGATTGVTFTVTANGAPAIGVAVGLTATAGGSDAGTFDVSATSGGAGSGTLDETTNRSGEVTVYLRDTKAGDTGTVTASAMGRSATTGTLTITAGAPMDVTAVTDPTAVLTAGGPATATIKATDTYGNPVSGTLQVGTASGDLGLTGLDSSPNGSPPLYPASVTLTGGTGTFAFKPVDANNTQALTAQIVGGGAAVTGNAMTVQGAGAVGVGTVTEKTAATAGIPVPATITLADAYGNTASTSGSYNVGTAAGDLNLTGLGNSPSGATPAYPSTVTFTSGSATVDVTPVDANNTQALSAEIVSGPGTIVTARSPIDVSPGPAESGYVVSASAKDSVNNTYTLSPGPTTWTTTTGSQTVSDEASADPPDATVLTFQAVDRFANKVTGGGSVALGAFVPGTTAFNSPDGNTLTTHSPVTATGGTFTVDMNVLNTAGLVVGNVDDELPVGSAAGGLVNTVQIGE